MSDWEDIHQKFEKDWWGNCINTYGEETKQLEYASRMGLDVRYDSKGPYIDLQGKSVLDMGGGPVSLLLKCVNRGVTIVVDPMPIPYWCSERYASGFIEFINRKGEELGTLKSLPLFDEVWIYNVLQHTEDPAKIVKNIRKCSKIIRVFDWLEISGIGHPQHLTEEKMNEWFGGEGKVEIGNGGKMYSGIFLGDHYEKS